MTHTNMAKDSNFFIGHIALMSWISEIHAELVNRNYSGIISVNQGGAVLAALLSADLGIPIEHDTNNLYGGISSSETTPSLRYLIVDDIINTGDTLHSFLVGLQTNNKHAIAVDMLFAVVSGAVPNDTTKDTITSPVATQVLCMAGEVYTYTYVPTDVWVDFWWEQKGDVFDNVESHIKRLMQYIGEDTNREGLKETPARVVKSWDKIYGGYNQDPADVMKTFTEGACDEMVILKDIELYSMCEHHMIPFVGVAHIAYIPNGKVIGISKLARLLEIFARRLQIQERIGTQVVDALNEHLAPLGAACIIEAQHMCMTARGVEKQRAVTITSAMTGVFKENAITRQELMTLIKG